MSLRESFQFFDGIVSTPASFIAMELDIVLVPVVRNINFIFGDHPHFDPLLEQHAFWFVLPSDGFVTVETLLEGGRWAHRQRANNALLDNGRGACGRIHG